MSGKNGKRAKNNKDDYMPEITPDSDKETEMEQHQANETEQIIETGTVTPTKGKYTIHCLTIVGQIVIVGNMRIVVHKTALESRFHLETWWTH